MKTKQADGFFLLDSFRAYEQCTSALTSLPILKVACSPTHAALQPALHAGGPTLQGQATETAAVQDRVQQHRVAERHAAGLADRARGEAASHFEESTRAPGSEEGRGRRC